MKQLAGIRSVFSIFGVLALGACGATPVPDGAVITGLRFTTASAFPENPPPTNVDVTLTDPTPSRAIYDATIALPDFPPGHFNCPADLGYSHEITFTNGQAVVVTATLNEGGCRDATISGAPPVRQTTDAYWTLVAQNLGIEESTLFSFAGP
jgi:hypothetical protein